jgi:transposase
MAYQVIHTKKDGKKYVYSAVSYWDKEKKVSRNRQVCLGRLCEETGEIIPSNRKARTAKRAAVAPEVTASSLIIGPYVILEKICHDVGLEKVLRKSFPDRWEKILSLAMFLTHKGVPLSRCDKWSKIYKHPYDKFLSSQDVSKLLASISEGEIQRFESLWMNSFDEKEFMLHDTSSVSSYSKNNKHVKWGHNRDKEKLPQVNIGLIYFKKSKLPASFRRLPGNISDVSSLKTTVALLDYMGQEKLTFVLDRGFYSKANIDSLLNDKHHFIIKVPRNKWVKDLYDEYRDKILSPENRIAIDKKEVLYAITKLHNWEGRRCYAHIYFNNKKAVEEIDSLSLNIAIWKEELTSGQTPNENKWAYEKYFHVKETPKRGRKVIENTKAVQASIKAYSGFSCILTTKKMSAIEALKIYRSKQTTENGFDDLKNSLDMKRLRIHSDQAMDSRIFIQFIALILSSAIRNARDENPNIKIRRIPVREILESLENISEIRYSGRYGKIITEKDPLQRDIFKAFSVKL